MGLMPNIKKKTSFVLKTCSHCGQPSGSESFAPTKSLFYPDGVIPICNSCVEQILAQHDYDWAVVDKVCQLADVPFVPKEWERLREMTETDLFYRYASIFMSAEYEGLGWSDYHQAFLDLKRQNKLEAELPEIADEKRKKLKEKWGGCNTPC